MRSGLAWSHKGGVSWPLRYAHFRRNGDAHFRKYELAGHGGAAPRGFAEIGSPNCASRAAARSTA